MIGLSFWSIERERERERKKKKKEQRSPHHVTPVFQCSSELLLSQSIGGHLGRTDVLTAVEGFPWDLRLQ